jgi:hypothetical protein
MTLITFILVSYGLTAILVHSKLLKPIRPTYNLFHCAQCMGFWVGLFLFLISPYTSILTVETYNMITGFLLGCLSSGTSYILCKTFNIQK